MPRGGARLRESRHEVVCSILMGGRSRRSELAGVGVPGADHPGGTS